MLDDFQSSYSKHILAILDAQSSLNKQNPHDKALFSAMLHGIKLVLDKEPFPLTPQDYLNKEILQLLCFYNILSYDNTSLTFNNPGLRLAITNSTFYSKIIADSAENETTFNVLNEASLLQNESRAKK